MVVPSFKMLSNILYASPLSSRTEPETVVSAGGFLVPSSSDLDRFRNCPSLGTSNRHDGPCSRTRPSAAAAAVAADRDDDDGGGGGAAAGISVPLFLLAPVSARYASCRNDVRGDDRLLGLGDRDDGDSEYTFFGLGTGTGFDATGSSSGGVM